MPFNKDGSRKTVLYNKSSGFKMKGSPMQRNFGISPLKVGKTSWWDKVKSAGSAVVAGLTATDNFAQKAARKYRSEKKKYRKLQSTGKN